jgi:hypothetical protein
MWNMCHELKGKTSCAKYMGEEHCEEGIQLHQTYELVVDSRRWFWGHVVQMDQMRMAKKNV